MTDDTVISLAAVRGPQDEATLEEALLEVRRELNRRRQLYPRLIREGKLPPEVATERMRGMDGALRWLLKHEQPDLGL